MASVEEVLEKLEARARPDQLEGMVRYGMAVDKRLGVAVPDMRKIAKETRVIDSKAARWIASDAIRNITSDTAQQRLRKKRGKGDNRFIHAGILWYMPLIHVMVNKEKREAS